MNSLTQTILTFVLSGGLMSFATAKYTKKQAEANAMKAMQDIYQEIINDLRSDRDALKSELLAMRSDREAMKVEMSKMKEEISINRQLYNELKPYKCTDLSCIKRKA